MHGNNMLPLDESDLNHVLDHTRELWEEIRGEQIFITGGTGFFGCWLLETFLWANKQLKLGASASILSRSPKAFLDRMPHIQDRQELHWIQGDVVDFYFPDGDFSFVIHAATEASVKLTKENPGKIFDTIVNGTRRTIEFAQTHATKKLLLTSSGAVYGKQPSKMDRIPEDYLGAPNPLDPASGYGEGKRAAELLCATSSSISSCEMKIARCFAFVGPHLPMDAHFAIGNFIRDAMQGNQIVILGDGTPLRSYLYASDLAIWLWKLLIKGRPSIPYNVGSDESISIANLANLVSSITPGNSEVKIMQLPKAGTMPEKYVPSIERLKTEFDISDIIQLKSAIIKTEEWLNKSK
jgi:nucleoside-diphosphate-sugar epimerase